MVREPMGKYITAIHRNMDSIFSYKLKDLDFMNGQLDFLFVISKNEGISQKDLSNLLYIGKSTTAKAVKKLENSGYIIRKHDEKDKRFNRIYLTEKGKDYVPLMNETFLEVRNIYSHLMSDEEYEQTLAILKMILNKLNEERNRLNEE